MAAAGGISAGTFTGGDPAALLAPPGYVKSYDEGRPRHWASSPAGAECRALRATRSPPGTLVASSVVERHQQPRQSCGLAFLPAFAHDEHHSPRMTSLLREELRLAG